VRFDAGDYGEAAADAERASNLFAAAIGVGEYSSNLGKSRLALARALQASGNHGEAQDAYRAAAEQLQNTLGTEHRDTRNARQQASLALPRRHMSRRV
jgi:tetratricopeptide (TPR) repeat protein